MPKGRAKHEIVIWRGYVTVGDRQVHYRRAGTGPPVVLIHQSPTSGKTLDLQTRTFAQAFTAIAIDIPGLGQSDPLPVPNPVMADLAIGLAETLDALGIERTALYGSHTGASICVEFARRYPERTAVALLDGYPIYTAGERARRLATYFQPFTPTFDGAHLLWLWYRYREQYLFWPWNVASRATRADADVPDAAFLHSGVIDVLEAGNDYKKPYMAAFRYVAEEPIPHLLAPVVFLAYPDDSLFKALELLPPLPDCCRIERMPRNRIRAAAAELAILKRFPAPKPAPEAAPPRPILGGVTRSYLAADGLQLAVRHAGQGRGVPLVMLSPAPGSVSWFQPLLRRLAETRPVVGIDLPGCGDSDPFPRGRATVAAMASAVAAALARLGIEQADLYGLHGGANVAVEVAVAHPGMVRRLVLDAPIALADAERLRVGRRYAPPIRIRPDGTHWIGLWHAVRDEQFFFPWYQRTRAAIRHAEPRVDPAELTLKVASYMKNHGSYADTYRAIFAFGIAGRLKRLTQPTLVAANVDDVFFSLAEGAAKAIPGARFAPLSWSLSEQLATLNGFLGG
ncbi:MAG: alpha/beta hydrolase [Alphaproteobacteria bacterium]|nr:alpha/beta hydrolase [Alphaproteobacteria bacterium]